MWLLGNKSFEFDFITYLANEFLSRLDESFCLCLCEGGFARQYFGFGLCQVIQYTDAMQTIVLTKNDMIQEEKEMERERTRKRTEKTIQNSCQMSYLHAHEITNGKWHKKYVQMIWQCFGRRGETSNMSAFVIFHL